MGRRLVHWQPWQTSLIQVRQDDSMQEVGGLLAHPNNGWVVIDLHYHNRILNLSSNEPKDKEKANALSHASRPSENNLIM